MQGGDYRCVDLTGSRCMSIQPDGLHSQCAAWNYVGLNAITDVGANIRVFAGSTAGFEEYARRRGDFAMAGAAALLDIATDRSIRRAAVVVFGVEPSPVRLVKTEQALIGRKLDGEAIEMAAAQARGLDAMSDAHVTADYRLHLAGVVSKRALAEAGQIAELPA